VALCSCAGARGLDLRSVPRNPGWLVAALLAGYAWFATVDWNVPYPGALPFGPLWIAATAAVMSLWVATGRPLTPVAAIALGAVAAMTLTDVSYLATQGLRDLHLYLRAGQHYLDGVPVYLDALFTQRPADLADYPFLYPPLTLPFFAALAQLPGPIVDGGWLALSVAAAVATLRLFGVRWADVPVFLLWPPFFQGIQVGNVAVPLGLLFALAPWFGAGLVIAAIFKLYSGIAALWLPRERRPVELAVGVGIVAALALATLPLVGTGLWGAWLGGLDLFRQSQPLLADYLYGFGLPRYVPEWLALAIAAVLALIALRSRGRDGLARLGLVTVVASPSLYAHGLIVAVPAFLSLRSLWLWTALAITSVAPGIAWWAAVLLAVTAWRVPTLRRDPTAGPAAEPFHPLAPRARPSGQPHAHPDV
jgi:hypothetical protein